MTTQVLERATAPDTEAPEVPEVPDTPDTTEAEAPAPAVTNTLRVLGCEPIRFDPRNAEDVAIARGRFEQVQAQGYLAYQVERSGTEDGEVIRTFNPEAAVTVLVPQMQGG